MKNDIVFKIKQEKIFETGSIHIGLMCVVGKGRDRHALVCNGSSGSFMKISDGDMLPYFLKFEITEQQLSECNSSDKIAVDLYKIIHKREHLKIKRVRK